MKIEIVGFDPAMANLGIARATLDLHSLELENVRLKLITTDSQSGKTVRKSSDDLRRARMLTAAVREACEGVSFAVAEVPTGTQSARGALGNGIAIGVLASISIPLIEVNPTEVKLASTGCKTSTKPEMIAWAIKRHPTANWLLRKSKGELKPIAANEHLADACAILEAGMKTEQFRQAVAMYLSMKAA